MIDEALKGMPDGLKRLLEQLGKDSDSRSEPPMTDEQGERLAVQMYESLLAAKSQLEAIKAKGGREAEMETVMVLIEALRSAYEKAGVPDPVDSQGSNAELSREFPFKT